MTLSEIIAELQAKREALEWEYSKIEDHLAEVRKLVKGGEDIKEKILSIGFAITRLESLIQPDTELQKTESTWGPIDEQ